MKTSLFRKAACVSIALALGGALCSAACAAEPAEPKREPEPKPKQQFDNPVRKISGMMKKAGELLDKLETGKPTQEEQKKILAELDRLIEMAQKACSSSPQPQPRPGQQGRQPQQQPGNTGGASPGSSPAPDEKDILRPVKTRLGRGAVDLREVWGKLPDVRRDDVMQLLNEKLPVKYKQLLILYFKALSEKK